MVAQLANTFAEFEQLNIDTQAALDFIEKGPYSIDDLRVSAESASFSSYREFYKGLPLAEFLSKRFGRAGDGYEYHHLVEQGGQNSEILSAQDLQNTDNIVRIPALLHEAINGIYSQAIDEADRSTFRVRPRSETFSFQREEAIRTAPERC